MEIIYPFLDSLFPATYGYTVFLCSKIPDPGALEQAAVPMAYGLSGAVP